jgi:hypothetical protein
VAVGSHAQSQNIQLGPPFHERDHSQETGFEALADQLGVQPRLHLPTEHDRPVPLDPVHQRPSQETLVGLGVSHPKQPLVPGQHHSSGPIHRRLGGQ